MPARGPGAMRSHTATTATLEQRIEFDQACSLATWSSVLFANGSDIQSRRRTATVQGMQPVLAHTRADGAEFVPCSSTNSTRRLRDERSTLRTMERESNSAHR